MATLHIEHAITDLATWRAAFDRFAERAHGGRGRGTRASPNRSTTTTTWSSQLDFTSTGRARGVPRVPRDPGLVHPGELARPRREPACRGPGCGGPGRGGRGRREAHLEGKRCCRPVRNHQLRLRRSVDLRLVAGAECRDGARWREHLRDPARGTSAARAVAVGGPWHHASSTTIVGMSSVDDKRARRQVRPAHPRAAGGGACRARCALRGS